MGSTTTGLHHTDSLDTWTEEEEAAAVVCGSGISLASHPLPDCDGGGGVGSSSSSGGVLENVLSVDGGKLMISGRGRSGNPKKKGKTTN